MVIHLRGVSTKLYLQFVLARITLRYSLDAQLAKKRVGLFD